MSGWKAYDAVGHILTRSITARRHALPRKSGYGANLPAGNSRPLYGKQRSTQMVVGHHKKPRFQVDIPQPTYTGAYPPGTARVSRRIRRKKPRFRLSFDQPRHRRQLAEQVARGVQRLRGKYATTLSQRRHLRRGTLLAIVCLVFVAVLSTPFIAPLLRSYYTPSTSSPNTIRTLHATQIPSRSALLPFPSLAQHVVTTDQLLPDILAPSAFVFDPEQGWIFLEKNADTQQPMASLTKIMTLLLTVENGNLDQEVRIAHDAAALVNSNNSYMGVSEGEVLSVRELLYGLIVASGNDAAVALADHVSGSSGAFVTQMNARATQLGLTNTTFISPDGANDGNLTSAHDLAILAAVALQKPEVQQITSTYHYQIPQTNQHKAFDMTSGNDLLAGGRSPYPGANGIKTGFTNGALYCIAFSARVKGHLIVGVVLGAPSPGARMADVRTLLDWSLAQEPCLTCSVRSFNRGN